MADRPTNRGSKTANVIDRTDRDDDLAMQTRQQGKINMNVLTHAALVEFEDCSLNGQ